MAAHTSSFFRTPALHGHKQGQDYGIINVGGEQFHAAAVAFIDYVQSGSAINDATLKKILGRFYHYFPQYLTNDTYLTTPKERLEQLLNNSRKSELVECMAYVLRQITIDEVYADSLNLNYREIFTGLTADTSKNYLRDPHTKLPVSAFTALERALDLPVTLSFKEPGKELRMRVSSANKEQKALMIQVQEDEYHPGVRRKADFAYVGQLAVTAKPAKTADEEEGSLAEILKAITAANQDHLRAYEQQRNTILSMVAAGELTYAQLMDHYIALLPGHTPNASFIANLSHKAHPVISGAPENAEQYTTDLLSEALASWIVSGAITADQLFDRIENNLPATAVPR